VATPLSSSHECLIEITTDISCIDLERVHEWLARKSLWAGQMPRAVFDRAVRGSLCFGAIKQGATVGFARVIPIKQRSVTCPTSSSTPPSGVAASARS